MVADQEVLEMQVVNLLWKEYGISAKDVENTDPKLIDKLLLYHKTKNEIEHMSINRGGKR